jgi:hypothetical protein
VFDQVKPLGPIQHAERGAMLERLGHLTEAKAEYKPYFDEANKAPFGRLLSVPDRYRIPGSTLQSGIKFKPDTSALPAPTSQRDSWLARLNSLSAPDLPTDDMGALDRGVHRPGTDPEALADAQ